MVIERTRARGWLCLRVAVKHLHESFYPWTVDSLASVPHIDVDGSVDVCAVATHEIPAHERGGRRAVVVGELGEGLVYELERQECDAFFFTFILSVTRDSLHGLVPDDLSNAPDPSINHAGVGSLIASIRRASINRLIHDQNEMSVVETTRQRNVSIENSR